MKNEVTHLYFPLSFLSFYIHLYFLLLHLPHIFSYIILSFYNPSPTFFLLALTYILFHSVQSLFYFLNLSLAVLFFREHSRYISCCKPLRWVFSSFLSASYKSFLLLYISHTYSTACLFWMLRYHSFFTHSFVTKINIIFAAAARSVFLQCCIFVVLFPFTTLQTTRHWCAWFCPKRNWTTLQFRVMIFTYQRYSNLYQARNTSEHNRTHANMLPHMPR